MKTEKDVVQKWFDGDEEAFNLKVVDFDYQVISQQDLVFDNEICFGYWEQNKQRIYVEYDSTDERKKRTILHEVFHTLSGEYGIEINEPQVRCLANTMFSFIKNNREFIESIWRD
ncbi:MAG: hypothetical protein WC940_02925 [Candidatus Paceibacterota bacterium]|jgi:Zn-dependent peptidase ImmA (M78 family)